MNDLEEAMWEAWKKVGPMLKSDPDELKARLARRRSKMYLRPPRAWCLAVRASDHRIEPYAGAAMVPEDADDPKSEWHPGRVVEHRAWLNKPLLVRMCAPLDIEPPGEPADQVAKKLGCGRKALGALRRNGTLRVHYVKGLLGRHGRPVPMVYTPESLDPNAAGKARPDRIWGCLWRMHAQSLPDGFEYELTRVPHYRCWHGHEQFLGWRWVCPGCKKKVRIVYYPMEIPDWGEYVGFKCARDEVDARPRPNSCFACEVCHGVVHWKSTGQGLRESWLHLVLCMSGGLMYGREVKRPAWLKPRRKRAAHEQRARPAPRREEMARLLGQTEMSAGEIAREMGVRGVTVKLGAWSIYKRYGVKNRIALKAKMAERPERAAG